MESLKPFRALIPHAPIRHLNQERKNHLLKKPQLATVSGFFLLSIKYVDIPLFVTVYRNLLDSIPSTTIKNAKTTTYKPFKIADEKGMYVLIYPNGCKYFRLDYCFNGKSKTLALDTCPETSLKKPEKNSTLPESKLLTVYPPRDELVHHENYSTRVDAKQSVFEYIEVFFIIGNAFILAMVICHRLIMNCSAKLLNRVSGKVLIHQSFGV